jgi:hypothetical protein
VRQRDAVLGRIRAWEFLEVADSEVSDVIQHQEMLTNVPNLQLEAVVIPTLDEAGK